MNKALSNFKKAYKINNSFSKTLINIGNILSLKDKNNFAILAYKKALKNIDDKAEVLGNITIDYSRKKDLKNTIKYFKSSNIFNSSHTL